MKVLSLHSLRPTVPPCIVCDVMTCCRIWCCSSTGLGWQSSTRTNTGWSDSRSWSGLHPPRILRSTSDKPTQLTTGRFWGKLKTKKYSTSLSTQTKNTSNCFSEHFYSFKWTTTRFVRKGGWSSSMFNTFPVPLHLHLFWHWNPWPGGL